MAQRNTTKQMSAFLSLLALMWLTLLDPSAAVPEKKLPSRPYRLQPRHPNGRSPLPQFAGMRTVRRFRGQASNLGESARRVNYAALKPTVRSEENKQRASESVHVVSLPSMNLERKSQPVYRAAVTKLKIPENDSVMKPKEVSARVLSSQSVLVTWVDPVYEKSAKVDANRHYTIRYREKGESARWDYKEINTRRVLVDKLNPDAMYEFSVRISQGDQDGQWSASIFQRTPESAPTTAPENLYVESLNGKSTAVTATWDELIDSAGKIKEYIISYAPAMKPFGGKSVTYSGTTTSAIIDGLQPGERYIFKIRAANRRGQGPQSKAFTVIMPDASSVTKNHKSHIDYEKVQKPEEEEEEEEEITDHSVVPSESSEEDTLESFPKTSFKNPREKLRKSGIMPAPNRKPSSVGNHQSTEVTDDSETTSTPKLSTPIPSRRFRPPFNNQFNPNTARKPSRTTSLDLGRRIIARKPIPPSVVIGEENESKNSKIEESNLHTVEDNRSKDSGKITQERTGEEHLNEGYDDLRNTNPKQSTIDSSKRETASRTNMPNVQDLGQGRVLPSSPSSKTLKKEIPSINNGGDINIAYVSSEKMGSSSTAKLPTEHRSHHMPSGSMSEEKKDISARDKKPKSTFPLQSHRKPTHRFPIAAILQPQSKPFSSYNTDYKQPDSRLTLDKGPELSTDSHMDTNKDNQDLDLRDFKKTSKEHNLSKSRQQASARSDFTTSTLPPTSTTTTTIAPTTTTTTTAEAQTTTKSNKSYKLDKLPSNKSPPVPSFSGKSAADILEYYRRRSSQVNTNVGRKIIPNRHTQIQSVKTTEIPTTTVVTTLPAETIKSYNQNRLLDMPDKKEDPYLSSSEVPAKHHLHGNVDQEMHFKESREKESHISTKDGKKTSLVSSKHKTETHKTSIKNKNISKKTEQLKRIRPKQTEMPSVDSLAYSETSSNSEEHEEQPEERKITPNTSKKNTNLLVSSKAAAPSRSGLAMPTNRGKSTPEKSLNNAETLEAPLSHLPSNENINQGQDSSVLLSRDPFSQTDHSYNAEDNDETIINSKRQSFPMSRTVHNLRPISEKNPFESERKLLKPHMSSSGSETQVKPVPAPLPNSGFLTQDTGNIQSIPEKLAIPEKEENPTPLIRSRLSSYSNVRSLKNRHSNGNINNSVDSTLGQKQSYREDEELHVPRVGKGISHRPSRVFPYMNSRQAVLPRRISSTVLPTTSQPQSSRVPYHLVPSVSRQLNYGRSLFRTTALPTTTPLRTPSPTYSPSLLRQRMLNSRLGSPLRRQLTRPHYQQGNNGRPNMTPRLGNNGNTISTNRNGNSGGQRMIFGPEGTKWVVDLNRGLVLNPEGRYLQDSQGKPLRIKMGGDGRTIVDMNGTPIVSPDGLPLFGHGRFSKPVASPQDKPVLSLGGRPLRGLEVARTTRIPTTRMVTTPFPTTTTTTTLPPTTTTPEPTTVEPTTEDLVIPTCATGSFAQYDEEGSMIMGPDDKPDCYTEDSYSGQELIVTTEAPERVTYFNLDDDFELIETTQHPVLMTTTAKPPTFYDNSEIKSFDSNLVSEFDAAGKKRFTAPYVSYISKDPNTPCSLTDALEHFQVENLADLIPKEMEDGILPPKNISYNITVVAVEGCHSFVILDWAKPKSGDFITGYLVYSASYDDYLKNNWSARTAGGTNFPIENLKPNTRYYFKIQAKNPHGFGPMSPSVTYVTESDNPLLIVRPPGGEPIWIPYAFKHDSSYSSCHGKQYVKRTWYRKFVGVMLCNSLRYKIYLSENLRDTFYSVGDSWGRGEDHCQFVDSYMEGRTDPFSEFQMLPTVKGYYRQYAQEPVMYGQIGFGTPHNYVGWYECGVPIPGKW